MVACIEDVFGEDVLQGPIRSKQQADVGFLHLQVEGRQGQDVLSAAGGLVETGHNALDISQPDSVAIDYQGLFLKKQTDENAVQG